MRLTPFFESRAPKIETLEKEFNFKFKGSGWYLTDNVTIYIVQGKTQYYLAAYRGNFDQVKRRVANMFSLPQHTVEPRDHDYS